MIHLAYGPEPCSAFAGRDGETIRVERIPATATTTASVRPRALPGVRLHETTRLMCRPPSLPRRLRPLRPGDNPAWFFRDHRTSPSCDLSARHLLRPLRPRWARTDIHVNDRARRVLGGRPEGTDL